MTEKLLPDGSYLSKIYEMLNRIEQQEQEPMEAAAEAAYHSIKNGGLLHVFSTGHSHMIVEEMFYRSGGLVPINPILSDDLMLHTGAITSTQMERKSGKAAEVLGKASLQKGDTIIISSNTGINTVPVEAALYAKQKGLTVVCVTSKTISEQLKPRSATGKHLCDVSDIVIDNHAPFLYRSRNQSGDGRCLYLRQPVYRTENCSENRKPVLEKRRNSPDIAQCQYSRWR